MNRVVGVVGIDPQHLRTTVVLREGDGPAARPAPVGDGVRRSVPNAADTDGRWGSEAAAHRLAGIRPTDADTELYGWRCEAWYPEFRAGLHRRLTRYLGEVPPVPLHGYHTCVVLPPSGPGAADACWPGAETVGPTDALLCRWLTGGPGARSIVATAVGDNWSLTGAYRLKDTADGPRITRVGTLRRADGTGTWRSALLRRVLDRCPPTVLGPLALAVLDGVEEFATGLRLGDPDRQVTWAGPLADILYTPLTLTPRQFIAGAETGPAVAGLTLAVQRALRDLDAVDGDAEAPLIVVGGPGAVWPLRSALSPRLGTLWQSTDPVLDLACGASWWPSLRGWFLGESDGRVPAVSTASGGGEPNGVGGPGAPDSPKSLSGPDEPADPGSPAGTAPPETSPYDELPPWQRP